MQPSDSTKETVCALLRGRAKDDPNAALLQSLKQLLSGAHSSSSSGKRQGNRQPSNTSNELLDALKKLVDRAASPKIQQYDLLGQLKALVTAAELAPKSLASAPKAGQLRKEDWKVHSGEFDFCHDSLSLSNMTDEKTDGKWLALVNKPQEASEMMRLIPDTFSGGLSLVYTKDELPPELENWQDKATRCKITGKLHGRVNVRCLATSRWAKSTKFASLNGSAHRTDECSQSTH